MTRPSFRPLARLRATDGFTIGEVLATVVLVGLLTLAIAAGIGVAVKAYGDIRGHSDEQAVLNNAVTAVTDELRFAYDVNERDDGVIVFSSTVRDTRLYLGNDGSGTVTLFGAGAAGGETDPEADVQREDPIPLPLVNTAAQDKDNPGITASLAKLEYRDGLWTFSITVTGGARELSSGDLVVRSINTW